MITVLAITSGVLALISGLTCVHLSLELRQQDRLLAWSDERDATIGALYESAIKIQVIPLTNPLEGFKQHGMMSKNAIMAADTLMPALDERFGVVVIALRACLANAKALRDWEAEHPAPPRHWWQAKKAARTNRKPPPVGAIPQIPRRSYEPMDKFDLFQTDPPEIAPAKKEIENP